MLANRHSKETGANRSAWYLGLVLAFVQSVVLAPPALAVDVLTSAVCQTDVSVPYDYSFNQQYIYWAAVAVNPSGADDKDVCVYTASGGGGTQLACSAGTVGTDFVIGDFNHNALGTYYPRISYGSGTASFVTEWDDGPDILSIGSTVNGSVGGGSGDCGLVRVWDVYLYAGTSYRFTLTKFGTADVRLAFFKSNSAAYWAGRSSSQFEKAAAETPYAYSCTANDYYGVVVFNNSPGSPSASYTLRVDVADDLASAVCQTDTGVPHEYAFNQQSIYWAGVAVNPASGDDKDVCIYTLPGNQGTQLACSVGTVGTDFVVGDFNHNASGTYYPQVSYGSATASYVSEWDDDSNSLSIGVPVNGTVGGGSGACGLIRVWDIYLDANTTYRFTLTQVGSADVRLAFFRSNNAVYWAGRSSAQFERTATQTPYNYTAPATDWYGVVVFNNSPGSPSASYTLRVDLPDPLASAACQTDTGVPHDYSMNQQSDYWTAVAVNPSGSDDKDICVYSQAYGGGSQLACSVGVTGTDFVVGDFNHNTLGTYYPQVSFGSNTASYVTEWDDGSDLLALGTTVAGTVGGGSGSCGLVRVWDLALTGGTAYRFTLTKSGTADVRLALFRSNGAAYWAGRTSSQFEKTAVETPYVYTAPSTDLYGVVVFNHSPDSPSANYTIRVDVVDDLANAACQTDTGVPHEYAFNQQAIYWTAVAVNPAAGDDKDICVYTLPGGQGTQLACSVGITGTDYVIGDFNHNPTGTYYPQVSFGSNTASYVSEWDDSFDSLVLGVPVNGAVGGGSGDCGLIRVWDVYLNGGDTFRFTLTKAGAADVRLAFFRSNDAVFWSGRYSATFERTAAQTPYDFTAPADDWYGVVVFNASAGSPSATYTVLVDRVADQLADGVCESDLGVPYGFSMNQQAVYWTAVAVSPLTTDDKDICVFTQPDGGGTLLACSVEIAGTDYVVGDFNHNAPGVYYPQVRFGNNTAAYVTEWDDGPDALSFGTTVSGTVGGSTGDCGLIRVWDAPLTAGTKYRFTLTKQGSADVRLALFRSNGAVYWTGRTGAEFEKTAAETPFDYIAPAGDWYGVVVYNYTGTLSGSYTLRVDVADDLTSAVCQSETGVPHEYAFNQQAIYWTAVAVNPAAGDDKDICVYTLPGGQGTQLACSVGITGTDFVVGDFNHNPLGVYYPQVDFGSNAATYVTEWDDGPDGLPLGTTVNGAVGGGSGDCGLIRAWDMNLTAGETYRFTLTKAGTADVRLAFFKSAGGVYWSGRSGAEFEKTAAQTPYDHLVTANDWYGVVVFNDSPGSPGATYTLRVERVTIGIAEVPAAPPLGFSVRPNPAPYGVARVRFDIPQAAPVEVALFDATGRRLRTLVGGSFPAGGHEATWDGKNWKGHPVAAGTYYLVLKTGVEVRTQPLTVLR